MTTQETPPSHSPVQCDRRKFNQAHVMESVTATILAAAVLGTASGVGWLVIALPDRLDELQDQITHLIKSQTGSERKIDDHERRITILESR